MLGLPRGGVVVAAPVAEALHCPLDAVVVRKLGVPGRPELAMGAITAVAGQIEVVWNHGVLAGSRCRTPTSKRCCTESGRTPPARRRVPRPAPARARGNRSLLVDDGIATGATMRAALAAVRRHGRPPSSSPFRSAPRDLPRARREVDALVCPSTPRPFRAVGLAYADFTPTSDGEVEGALRGQEG